LKKFGYYLLKCWVSVGLFWYYRKIQGVGQEQVPKSGPILLLSNHQNALLDVLLIATQCGRKPWFLARSDVFKSPWVRPLFAFLQMLPIYRIRDGRDTLHKNAAIFEECGKLLAAGEAVVLFPEGNHSLKRRVRPLSKGFTRIIDKALDQNPKMDLRVVPIGQNYQDARLVGDSTAIHFGQSISVQEFVGKEDYVVALKQTVFNRLTRLTTHVVQEEAYDGIITALTDRKTDFTQPMFIGADTDVTKMDVSTVTEEKHWTFFSILFFLNNLPFILCWKVFLKPKVPETEFEGTFRFGFALLAYSCCYCMAFILLSCLQSVALAAIIVFMHAFLNLALVKSGYGRTSK